jgi:hypothetical protein
MTEILRVSEPNILELLRIENDQMGISKIETDKQNLEHNLETNFNDFFKEFINSIDKNNNTNNSLDNYQSLKNFIINNKKKTTIKKTFQVINDTFVIQCEYHDYNKDIVLNYEYNFFNNIDNLIRSIEDFNRYLTLVKDQTDLKNYCDRLIGNNDEINHYNSNKETVNLLNHLFLYSISLEDNIYCYKCVTNANKLKDHINHITYFNIFFADAYEYYINNPDSSDKYIYRITIMKGSKVLFYDKYIIISSNSYVFFNDNDENKFIIQSNNINLPYDIYPNKSTFKSIDVIIRNNIYSIENRNISKYIRENQSIINNLVIMCPLKIEEGELKISYPNFDDTIEQLIVDDDSNIKNFFLENNNTYNDYKNINKDSEISIFQKNENFSFIAVFHPNFEDIISVINDDKYLYNIFNSYYYIIYKCFQNNLIDNNNKQLCLFPICVPLKYREYENKIYRYLVQIFFYLNIEFNINPKIFFHEDDKFQLFKKTIEYYNNNCINVETRKLKFYDDSCYMDCFFYILFNTKNKFIEEFILKAPVTIHENNDNRNELYKLGKEIQKKLIEIYNFFNNKYSKETTCNKLGIRKLLQKYNLFYKSDEYIEDRNTRVEYIKNIYIFEHREQPISSLFNILYLIFDIPNFISATEIDDNLFTIDKFSINIRKDFTNYASIINNNIKIKIPNIYINIERDMTISSYDDKGIEIVTQERNDDIIKPTETIDINNTNNKLYLNSILIHKPQEDNQSNGHYLLLYKCNDYWYEYDDMDKKNININEKIGIFSNLTSNEKYTRNIVGLYYTQ